MFILDLAIIRLKKGELAAVRGGSRIFKGGSYIMVLAVRFADFI